MRFAPGQGFGEKLHPSAHLGGRLVFGVADGLDAADFHARLIERQIDQLASRQPISVILVLNPSRSSRNQRIAAATALAMEAVGLPSRPESVPLLSSNHPSAALTSTFTSIAANPAGKPKLSRML